MRAHVREFRLVAMCRVLGVQRSGYYAWLRHGASARKREDQRLLGLIKHHWLASGTVYGYRKITLDLREAGERCSRHRVLRLMKAEGLRAQVGYGRKPRHRGGPVGLVTNVLNRDFTPEAPNKVWVTDITYKGADQATDLPDTRHGGIGRVRLHRDVLQPDPPAWFRWRTVTGRV